MVVLVLILLSFLIFVVPRNLKSFFNILPIVVLVAWSSFYSVQVLLSGVSFSEILPVVFWGHKIELIIDPLSAFFICIINFTVLTGSIFSIEYMKMYGHKSSVELSIHYFSFFILHLSMILVTMIHQGIAFLVVWELMAVSSFMLVIFENEKGSVLRAGINYLIQMHIGALFLISAFILLYLKTGSFDFEALKLYFSRNLNIPMFLLFLVGFGIKAGFMPFHTWLPHAHPAAPTHVSAVMSGVMIKLGIYGLLRVFMFVQSDILWIGVIVLLISLLSGVGGVAFAIIQHDLKKLLAYHSIENIGIIGMGMGIGIIGIALQFPMVAFLGFAGCLLHVLNHSLFKSLLFYGSGVVYMKTHTRNIEYLGGLIKKMPITALLFLIASLAICGLPPFNGFVSEFLIYNGIIEGLAGQEIWIKVLMLMSLTGLVLIGGLAIFCFTKAFSVVFLGNSRKSDISGITEAKWYTTAPLIIIALCIVFIGLFPQIAIRPVSFVVNSQFVNIMASSEVYNNMPLIQNVGIASMVLIGIILLILVLRMIITRNASKKSADTWGCAYNGRIVNGQYTATSFAENFSTIAQPLLNIKTNYRPIDQEDIFPKQRGFETESEDVMEQKVYSKFIRFINRIFSKMAIIQTGNTQHYILYAFLMIIVLLILTVLRII
jgi:hydrogenase-4 component B